MMGTIMRQVWAGWRLATQSRVTSVGAGVDRGRRGLGFGADLRRVFGAIALMVALAVAAAAVPANAQRSNDDPAIREREKRQFEELKRLADDLDARFSEARRQWSEKVKPILNEISANEQHEPPLDPNVLEARHKLLVARYDDLQQKLFENLAAIQLDRDKVQAPILHADIASFTPEDRLVMIKDLTEISKILKQYGFHSIVSDFPPVNLNSPLSPQRPTMKLYADLYKADARYSSRTVKMSVVSIQDATAAFRALKEKSTVVGTLTKYDPEQSDAVEMELEKIGIFAGNMTVKGNIYEGFGKKNIIFRNPVFPVVLVRRGETATPYVFDLWRHDVPIPVADWLANIWAQRDVTLFERDVGAVTLFDRYGSSGDETPRTSYSSETISDLNRMLYLRCEREEYKGNRDPVLRCGRDD